jgi:hypothetical protein
MKSPGSATVKAWQPPKHWQRSFAYSVQQFFDPKSELSKKYPHLNQVFQGRLRMALDIRGDLLISRCLHTDFPAYNPGRTDGHGFQTQIDSRLMDCVIPIENDDSYRRAANICESLARRMEIYGTIGTGCSSSSLPPKTLAHSFLKHANQVQPLLQFFLRANAVHRVLTRMSLCITLSRWKNTLQC